MADDADAALPAALVALFDGSALAAKIGHTAVLTACADGEWPRLALLSVGEVLALSPTRMRLAMYAHSGTTRAVAGSGRALLTVVADAAAHKVRLRARPLDGDHAPLRLFDADVVDATADRVGYARLTHGIGYELDDSGAVLQRWERQIALLRAGGAD